MISIVAVITDIHHTIEANHAIKIMSQDGNIPRGDGYLRGFTRHGAGMRDKLAPCVLFGGYPLVSWGGDGYEILPVGTPWVPENYVIRTTNAEYID